MRTDVMALNEKIAQMLQRQEWAKIIPEIPQLDRAKIIREVNERMARYAIEAKIQKNRSPYGEERGVNDEKGSQERAKANKEYGERYKVH